jgi:hypothetical protein
VGKHARETVSARHEGHPCRWQGCREDIHGEFDKASTPEQRGALLAIFHAVMNIVEKNLIAPDELEKFP